jgi:hypothetical protein
MCANNLVTIGLRGLCCLAHLHIGKQIHLPKDILARKNRGVD